MRGFTTCIGTPSQLSKRFSSSHGVAFRAVDTIHGPLDAIDIETFRAKAFIPEIPVLITTKISTETSEQVQSSKSSIPATQRWFEAIDDSGSPSQALSEAYLSPFGATILPYELVVDSNRTHTSKAVENDDSSGGLQELSSFVNKLTKGSLHSAFHRFNAPLSLFLQACRLGSRQQLYIAQAQIADLPKRLRDDLPTPSLVKKAGKGDVYDSNIWLGIPPTYTPLHKDPNPNLFVQLASSKRVRIFRAIEGAAILREVQQRIGQSSPSTLRGEEMMDGPERAALEESVWGHRVEREGYEVVVCPGDALFIPKGWWHSFKSIGDGVTASVNWWFR